MSTQEAMRQRYKELYENMASSSDVRKMKVFGRVMNEIMEWCIMNRPDMAQVWIEELESIFWENYLTTKEAEAITSMMEPKRAWPMDQWRLTMAQHELALEDAPYYNRCALYVVMNMLMSDSGETIEKYAGSDKLFRAVYDLAVDKLKDKDKRFNVREYFKI